MAKVGIVMGSDSDLPVMSKAAQILEQFGVEYEMTIISAHREPDVFYEYAKSAEEKGFKVIIAGAGMAAHLPGMVAAMTTLPVVGVPVKSRALNGLDSLLSIVQMPAGVPVATTAINGAKNAALIAASILSLQDRELAARLEAFRARQTADVLAAEGAFAEAELIGVCTDICVISNALLLKAFAPELCVSVRADCCAGATPAGHETALAAMRACQVDIV